MLKPTTDFDGQAQKAFELIQQLSTMVTANVAELIVVRNFCRSVLGTPASDGGDLTTDT